ncbi:MAG TPA: cysteine peptidase family C39 domain-containing protein [Blastocatellia bacterium]|nr:cysteine peptidase family C39 domain-containing protein [Blastocatellia bacterium]
MPSKPPFYKQETPDSCVPACLRMVFSSLGIDIEESKLRALCDCGVLGTDALRAVDAARQLGFEGSSKYTLSLGEMRTLVTEGCHPIAFVDLRPIDGVRNIHAVVVVGIGPRNIIVLDPLKGERSFAVQVFSTAWAMAHNLALIIRR